MTRKRKHKVWSIKTTCNSQKLSLSTLLDPSILRVHTKWQGVPILYWIQEKGEDPWMGLQTENFHRHTSNWGLWELSVVSMYYGPCLYYKHEIETTGLLSWEPTWTLDNIVMLIYVLHFDIFQCCVTHVWWHLTTHLNYSPAAKCLNFLLPLWCRLAGNKQTLAMLPSKAPLYAR